jgi:hypothetical protein
MPDGKYGHPITDESCVASDADINAIAGDSWRAQEYIPSVATDVHPLHGPPIFNPRDCPIMPRRLKQKIEPLARRCQPLRVDSFAWIGNRHSACSDLAFVVPTTVF